MVTRPALGILFLLSCFGLTLFSRLVTARDCPFVPTSAEVSEEVEKDLRDESPVLDAMIASSTDFPLDQAWMRATGWKVARIPSLSRTDRTCRGPPQSASL